MFQLDVKSGYHGLQVDLCQFFNVDHVVVPVLANGTPEANSTAAVFTKALNRRVRMLDTPVTRVNSIATFWSG